MSLQHEDEQAIRDLVTRYCDAIARRDAKAFGETWAEDAEWRIMGQQPQGRDAIVKLWLGMLSHIDWVLQLPNMGLVEVDGDRATGRWYVTERFRRGDEPGTLVLGVYHDEYVRTRDGWCFARRALTPLYSGPPDLTGEFSSL